MLALLICQLLALTMHSRLSRHRKSIINSYSPKAKGTLVNIHRD